MNPIFKEYYPHDHCECYKILLPWTDYAQEKIVLCKVSEGIELAKKTARGVLVEHMNEALKKEIK